MERHACSWALLRRDGISVNLEASNITFYQKIKPQLDALNLVLEVKNISAAVNIPCYYAIIFNPLEYDSHLRGGGLGCHLDPYIAINRAVTEAIQARSVVAGGAREDLADTRRLKGNAFKQYRDLFKYWYEPTCQKISRLNHRSPPVTGFKSAIMEIAQRVRAVDKHIGRFLYYTYGSPTGVWVTRIIIEGAELFCLDRQRRCPAIVNYLDNFNL